ncbi:MAG: ATP-binding protein [Clostridia bacterium]|nr:ATP-binding protein [Clostridia bacterium]
MSERNYYKEVHDLYRNKRERAEREAEERRRAVHEAIPQVFDIDTRLARTGSEILSAIMQGGDYESKIEGIRKTNTLLREKRSELLLKGGYPADYTDIVYECEKCADSGYVGLDMCNCMKAAIAEARLSDSELGRLCDLQSFENFDLSYYAQGSERLSIEHIVRSLRSFAEGFDSTTSDSWLLFGDTGLGKTHLSTAVGVTVIRRGYDVLYKTVQAVIDDFEEVQFKGASQQSIKRYYDCDLLIIDDLGAELTNQFTTSCIYNIMNVRMNKRKPTIISTNLTQKELRDRYADRITSRLFGEFKPLQFKGTDVRRQRLARK